MSTGELVFRSVLALVGGVIVTIWLMWARNEEAADTQYVVTTISGLLILGALIGPTAIAHMTGVAP